MILVYVIFFDLGHERTLGTIQGEEIEDLCCLLLVAFVGIWLVGFALLLEGCLNQELLRN